MFPYNGDLDFIFNKNFASLVILKNRLLKTTTTYG